jgi:hypothetical protein
VEAGAHLDHMVLARCEVRLSVAENRLGKFAGLHICPGYRMSRILEVAQQIDHHSLYTCRYCDEIGPQICGLSASGEGLASHRGAAALLEKIDSCRSFFQSSAVDFVRPAASSGTLSQLWWESHVSWEYSGRNFGDELEVEVDASPRRPWHIQAHPQCRGG